MHAMLLVSIAKEMHWLYEIYEFVTSEVNDVNTG